MKNLKSSIIRHKTKSIVLFFKKSFSTTPSDEKFVRQHLLLITTTIILAYSKWKQTLKNYSAYYDDNSLPMIIDD